MQTLRKPWSTLPGRCRAGVAGLPTRQRRLTSWLKQKEGTVRACPGIDLLETANLAAFAKPHSLTTRGRGLGPSECSAGQPGSVAAGGAGAGSVFESLGELCERLDETPLA